MNFRSDPAVPFISLLPYTRNATSAHRGNVPTLANARDVKWGRVTAFAPPDWVTSWEQLVGHHVIQNGGWTFFSIIQLGFSDVLISYKDQHFL